MDLQSRKIKFVQEFLKIQSEDVMAKLESILKIEHSDSKEKEVIPFTIEELNSRIRQSMEDSKNGKLIEDNELKSMIDTWK